MSGDHGGQDHPHTKRSVSQFYRTRIPNTSCRMSKMTFAVYALLLEKNFMPLYPAPLMTGMASFCRYRWLVMVSSTNIGPESPCLLIAHHTVDFAGWSDVSMTLCEFLEAQNIVFCLFTNPSRCKWASSLNHKQSKVVG